MSTNDEASDKPYVSRSEAIATGQTLYYTGKPCKYGHIAPRRLPSSDCTECNKVRAAAWNKAHEESVKARLRADYLANLPKRKAQKAANYAANREKLIAQSGAWKRANKDKVAASFKKNRPKHMLQYRLKEQRRRARKVSAGGTFTQDDVSDIRRLQKGKCALCKCSIKKRYHIDHIMPLALGGSNFRSNIQLLCAPCNLSKHAKHPIVFAQSRGLLL
jgi:5-methylcytosine-specific restriction endonuclease McrA